MKHEQETWKRLLSFVLSIAMTIGLIPGVGFLPGFTATAKAANPNQNYVSLPITIRDYADDGMLFEYNDVNESGENTYGGSAQPTVSYTAKAGGSYTASTPESGYIRYTSNSTGGYVTYTVSGGYTRTQMRYCVIKYRTNAGQSSQPTIGHRWNSGGSSDYRNLPTNGYNSGSFQTVIVDLGTGSNTVNYVTIYPRLAGGKYIDIAYIAFFENEADAESYKANDGKVGNTYIMGNNLNFGFLMNNAGTVSDTDDHMNSVIGAYMPGTSAVAGPSSVSASQYTGLVNYQKWGQGDLNVILENGAREQLIAGRTRIGLVQPVLGANKQIIYNQSTVDYLAWLLQKTLTVPEKDGDKYNFNYIMGSKLSDLGGKDLASVLRGSITGGMGTYEAARSKFEAGSLSQANQATTYYEAAYFLLHSIFTTNNGYGKELNNPYTELQLVEKTENGKTYYVFNSGYANAVYDSANGVIYNSQTTNAPGETPSWGYGIPVYDNRFDPIKNDGYGITGSRYVDIIGDSTDYYKNINYNMSLEGHAQFIYYQDAELYFTFEGDDDVYLFINDKLVLDLGGGHSNSKVRVNINDVADMCGLKDGQPYDFDFYYMERHGTAANFGIETNIRIVDPHMLTTKTGYQNGGEVGYNGFIDAQKPVQYQFGLQNNGDADIKNLTFRDDDIGVSLSKDSISLNSETVISDLIVTKYNADGSVAAAYKGMTDDTQLKQVLADGLAIGEKLTIYGFNYTIPNEKWSDNAFVNRVYTTAVATGENTSTKTLNGTADYKVQKQEYSFNSLHYYDWGVLNTDPNVVFGTLQGQSRSVTADKAELLKAITDAGVTGITNAAVIRLCTPSGATSGNINSKAVVNSDGSITYTGDKTGADTYFYQVKQGDAVYGPVRVDVYTYGIADNTYVLDYGLPVELNEGETALTTNDVVSLAGTNPYTTGYAVTGISNGTSNYGDFILNNSSLRYTLRKFMNDIDTVTVTIEVKEEGAAAVTKTTGVTMTQTVTTAPANVMYYEDTFADITYVGEDGNQWLLYEAVDEDGNKVTGDQQSADQNSNYGSDPNYDADQQGTLTLNTDDLTDDEINEVAATLDGDASNGTVHVMEVEKTQNILSFQFQGTGFEIISRTTSNDYAVLSVMVSRKTTDAEGNEITEIVKQFPVITECVNGDLYQVPVISVTDLPRDSYTVSLKAAASTAGTTRMVYIDGIRIYGPLNEDKAAEFYNPEEAGAEFLEIKKGIEDGRIVYSDISGDVLVSGTTMIEDAETDSGYILTGCEDLSQYLTVGPNNEIYLDGAGASAVIAFYVTPDGSTEEAARTIEIGAHRKVDTSFDDNQMMVNLVYGSSAEAIDSAENAYEIASGTEQYYTIDVSKLTPDADGRYLVLIGTNGGDGFFNNTLVLTNLKIAGYTISSAEAELTQLENSNLVNQIQALRTIRVPASDEPEETNPVNENLSVISAKFKTSSVVSGKSATLTVVTTTEAESIVVLDQNGSPVEFTKSAKTEKNGKTTFTFMWTVTGSKGDLLEYTIYAADSDGARSVNTETAAITIK